eukprot:Awhi_evm2s11209
MVNIRNSLLSLSLVQLAGYASGQMKIISSTPKRVPEIINALESAVIEYSDYYLGGFNYSEFGTDGSGVTFPHLDDFVTPSKGLNNMESIIPESVGSIVVYYCNR